MADFTYQYVDVKEESAVIFKDQLPKGGFVDVKVLKSDPFQKAELPCLAITREGDNEECNVIGDQIQAPSYNSTTMEYTVVKGTFFQEHMEYRIWHTNADERDRLYNYVKAVLLYMRERLTEKGILNIVFEGGQDEQDNTMTFASIPIYWGTITMTYLNPLNVQETSIIPPITTIPITTISPTGG
jgi:hypothetical protein